MNRLLTGLILTAVVAFIVLHWAPAGAAQAAAPRCPWVAAPAPDPRVHRPVIGRMTLKDIGLNTPIFQGWLPDIETEASLALTHGPAFYPQGMRWSNGRVNHQPGQGGTVAMLGHRTTRTHPFCLVASIRKGSLAVMKMRYGTYVYREVAKMSLLASDWSAFEQPAKYDPSPKKWNRGIKPEYLVIGACDPPHSAVRRLDVIFKLVRRYK